MRLSALEVRHAKPTPSTPHDFVAKKKMHHQVPPPHPSPQTMPPKHKKAPQSAQAAQAAQDDVSMTDAPPLSDPMVPENLPSLDEQRIRMLPGSSHDAASFEFRDEDHTLGNALRYIIMKNPLVEFCGYSIPHPSEAKMNVRIQTLEGTTAIEALEKGLDDLMLLCDVVADEFERARTEFTQQGTEEEMVG